MLINIKAKKGDVITMKLLTSEELICRLEKKEKNGNYIIRKPIQLTMAHTGQLAMIPFMVSAAQEEKIEIKAEHIIAVFKTREELKASYIQQTTEVVSATEEDVAGLTGSAGTSAARSSGTSVKL